MRTITIDGAFATKIYPTEDGYLAIEQSFAPPVLLAADEVLAVIEALQAHYERRAQWQEAIPD